MRRRTSGSANAAGELGRRQAPGDELLIVRDVDQQAQGGVMPGQDPGGAAGDLGVEAGPLLAGFERGGQLGPPQLRLVVDLEEHVGHRAVDLGREPAHPVDFLDGVEQELAGRAHGCQLEDAGAGLGQRAADAEELVLGGVGARDRLAVDGPVPDGARGGEPQCPGPDGLEHDGPHAVDLRPGWPARCGRPARPSRRRGRRRGGPGCRRRPSSAAVPGHRGTRGRSPIPTRSPRSGRPRGCPRRPP